MKRHKSRASRARREFWKRLGIWIFLFIFAFSVVGGLIAFTATLNAR
jgi:type VI protein secretion system component VasF